MRRIWRKLEPNRLYSTTWADKFGSVFSYPNIPTLPSNSIDIVTWNILGPLQGESVKHTSYASSSALVWWKRKARILRNLGEMSPAIICLQEISYTSLQHTFIPELNKLGYECASFAPAHPLFSPGPSSPNHVTMGCVIFTRKDKILVMSAKKLFLKNFIAINHCLSSRYKSDVLSKWHAMALCHLKIKATNQSFVLGNTHLFWDPNRQDIKALQTQAVVNGMATFAVTEFSKHLSSNLPLGIVLCGDFNSGPQPTLIEHSRVIKDGGVGEFSESDGQETPRSAVFQLLQSGELPSSHPEHPDSWYKRVPNMRSTPPRLGMLRSPSPRLLFSNVYHHHRNFRTHTPAFTSKTDDFEGWIDHIWVNRDIEVERVMSLPVTMGEAHSASSRDSSVNGSALTKLVERVRRFPCIPTEEFPSDHLPIGCVISLPYAASTRSV